MAYEARLMHVTKMHGARNDFVILDRRTTFDGDDKVRKFAMWACDRRAGIGADGLIVLEPSSVADVRMRTINSDGTEAEMCGNGVRCAARWLDEDGAGDRIAFETGAGIVRTEIVARKPEYSVRVAIGRPSVRSVLLPPFAGAAFVEVGNPHVVLFSASVDRIDLERTAEELQGDPQFSAGVNVHVAAACGERSLRARHWERGVGLTMACGTGAVACAAAAVERGTVASPVEVFVPGGRLVVEFDATGEAFLTGPAARVFDAEVNPP
jgi:diaminopimelate epimerase